LIEALLGYRNAAVYGCETCKKLIDVFVLIFDLCNLVCY